MFQYFTQVNDMDSMLKEKLQLVSSTDYGRDADAADKLLTKHKVHAQTTSSPNTRYQLSSRQGTS